MLEWVVSSCVLILLVIFLRYAFREKISLKMRYCLWAVVALRLLIPLSFSETFLSVLNLLPGQEQVYTGVDVNQGTVYQSPAKQEDLQTWQQPANADAPIATERTGKEVENIGAAVPSSHHISVAAVLQYLWLGGALMLGALVLGVNVNYGRKLKKAGKLLEKDLVPTASELPVYETDRLLTPCMFGLFRPCIYITEEARENKKTFTYVICHENVHYRHKDNWWALVRTICLCLHWYNPLVWWAVSLSRQDGELACDEGALKLLGEENRVEYGRALLELSVKKGKGLSSLRLSTAMTGRKKQMKERLKMIVDSPKKTMGALVVLLALVAVVLVATFTGREQKPSGEPESMEQTGGEESREDLQESAESAEASQEQTQGSEEPVQSQESGEQGYSGDGINDENEVWIWGYSIYTGYLDVCTQWTDYERFVNLDLDGDGLTDRVWRESLEDVAWSPANYRIDFGNGDVAEIPGMSGGVPQVRAADVNGDGQNEILFTQSYDFSTDPRNGSQSALMMRNDDGSYTHVKMPENMQMETASTDIYGVYHGYDWETLWKFEPAGDMTLRFIYEEDDARLDEIKTYEQEEWEGNGYAYMVAEGEEHTGSAYQVDVVRDEESGKDILKLHYSCMGKWSGDEIVLSLEFADGRMRVKKAQYLEYYEEKMPVELNGTECELIVSGYRFRDEEIYTIDWINLFEMETRALVGYVDPREVSKAYRQTGEDEEPYPIRSSARNGDVRMQDMNGDSHKDLCFAGWTEPEDGVLYFCMHWNPEKQEFEYGGASKNVRELPEER